jgi:hypothetical protein
MPQFRYITTSFTLCRPGHDHTLMCQWGKVFPMEAIEWIGTGLAIQHLCHPSHLHEYYGILHIASGRLLTAGTTPTLVEAAMWLQSIKDLTDWTQPGEILQAKAELQTGVYEAQKQTFHRYNGLLRGKKLPRK